MGSPGPLMRSKYDKDTWYLGNETWKVTPNQTVFAACSVSCAEEYARDHSFTLSSNLRVQSPTLAFGLMSQ